MTKLYRLVPLTVLTILALPIAAVLLIGFFTGTGFRASPSGDYQRMVILGISMGLTGLLGGIWAFVFDSRKVAYALLFLAGVAFVALDYGVWMITGMPK